ncbi:MAG: ribosomal RNA small subunit methyltransferase I [Ilumatobacteraceae bacterium]
MSDQPGPPTGPGTLWLVGTPIGNLGDLTPRAIEVLRDADLVCCEDTRRTGKLLQHAGVRANRLAVANDHTEYHRIADVLDVLGSGGDVAVVTDAGMPGVSDPGERLVRAAVDAGYTVSAVPGPGAVTTALVISGLPTERFVFEGFLPVRGATGPVGYEPSPTRCGRSCCTRRRIGSSARWPIWRTCAAPIVGSPCAENSPSSTRK